MSVCTDRKEMALSHLTEQLPRCSQPCLFTSVQKNTFLLLWVLQGQLSKVFYGSYINGIVKQFSIAVVHCNLIFKLSFTLKMYKVYLVSGFARLEFKMLFRHWAFSIIKKQEKASLVLHISRLILQSDVSGKKAILYTGQA